MRNHIKITSVLLALILTFSIYSIVPFTFSAAETGESLTHTATGDEINYVVDPAYPDFVFSVSESGDARITSYTGSDKEVTIPAALGGYPVTYFDFDIFRNCSEMEVLNIPATVTWLHVFWTSFEDCDSLHSINVDENNPYYQSIDGVLYSKEEDFLTSSPTLLKFPPAKKSITFPDSVSFIGSYAFYGCNELVDITLPDSITYIGWDAFARSTSLRSVVIPESVTEIDEHVFSECPSLQTVIINARIDNIPYGTFSECPSLKKVHLPEGITSIKHRAFLNCQSLEEINLPDTLNSIGLCAFYDCTSLLNIDIPEGVSDIGDDALTRTAWLDAQPDGLLYINQIAYLYIGECPSTITLKPGTRIIASRAFLECDQLQSIEIPESVDQIGDRAFSDCTSLASIQIPKAITIINSGTFADCSSLKSIEIPEHVTELGYGAFAGCTSLEAIDIPASVTYIWSEVFRDCTALKSIMIPDSVTEISWAAFMNCSALKSIILPDHITQIDSDAFRGCTSLDSVTLPSRLRDINSYAFYQCPSLKSITLPSSIEYISSYALGYHEEKVIDDVYDEWEMWHYEEYPLPDFTIYGYAGSEAERYAEENGFEFISTGFVSTDEDTSVSVISEENVEITVQDITYEYYEEDRLYIAYDITLSKDGESAQPQSGVTVRIPWWYSPYAKVYRVEADGSRTDMNAVYCDGYPEFTTDHFSVYLVFEGTRPVILGDVDGDDIVTPMDASAIQRCLAGMAVWYFDEAAADVDGDGEIASIDATWIQRYIAGMPSSEGINKPIEND